MIKLVVFDWNGTLFADSFAIAIAANQQLAALGQGPQTLAFYREHFDIPLINLFHKVGLSTDEVRANPQKIADIFHEFYEPMAARARTRRGARVILQTLQQKNIAKVILSNHPLEDIQFQLNRLGLSSYFELVLANELRGMAYLNGKQERLSTYLQQQHFKPAEVLIIGDTLEEIRIGKALGLHTVAITDGYASRKRLKAAQPDYIIHKLADLAPILDQLY